MVQCDPEHFPWHCSFLDAFFSTCPISSPSSLVTQSSYTSVSPSLLILLNYSSSNKPAVTQPGSGLWRLSQVTGMWGFYRTETFLVFCWCSAAPETLRHGDLLDFTNLNPPVDHFRWKRILFCGLDEQWQRQDCVSQESSLTTTHTQKAMFTLTKLSDLSLGLISKLRLTCSVIAATHHLNVTWGRLWRHQKHRGV